MESCITVENLETNRPSFQPCGDILILSPPMIQDRQGRGGSEKVRSEGQREML